MGFKSFARPTRLEFPQGITALVGPNGSGKSNVVDAIRWSLGEQSARDLRGQRADDVIYAGPRRVHGSAEVELTFESTSGETLWSELAIARRLFRSGESEYLLNRARRRLRDVQTALHEVGMSNPRFAVVNQGMTDFLLSATPAERRALLEQAAGLAAYRQRRDEAAHKLAATEQNIATIEVVLAELEPRLRVLRRQAKGVEEREGNVARLRRALTDWYTWRWQQNSEAMYSLHRDVNAAAQERRSAIQETMELEEIAERSLQRERTWRAELESATAALHTTERERDGARHDVNAAAHQLESTIRRIEQESTRRAQLVEAVSGTEERRSALANAVEALDNNLRKLTEDNRAAGAEVQTLRRAVDEREELLRTVSRRYEKTADETQRLQRDLSRLHMELDRADARRNELSQQVSEIVREHSALQQQQTGARELSELLQVEEAAAQNRFLQADEETRTADERQQRLARILKRASEQIAATTRELGRVQHSLANLERAIGNTVLGTLTVRNGWEKAVAAALGDWALLGRDAVRLALKAELNSFLTWRKELERQVALDLVWLDELMDSADELPAAIPGTIVTETDSAARETWHMIASREAHLVGSPTVQVVARTGLCLSAAGTRREPMDNRAALYLRTKREASSLASRLETFQHRRQRWQALSTEADRIAASRRQRAAEIQREVVSCRNRSRQHALDTEHLERRLHRLDADRHAREREQQTLTKSVHDMQSTAHVAERRAEALAKEQSDLQTQVRDARDALESCRRDLAAGQERAAHVSREAQSIRLQRDSQLELANSLEREVRRLEAEVAQIQREHEQLEATRLEAARRSETASKLLEDLESIHAEQVARVAAVRTSQPDERDIREPLRDARSRASSTVSRHERLSARLGEVQAERMKLSEEIMRELGLQVGELGHAAPSDVPTEDELRRLRLRAAQYVELDASVVEEYRELLERQRYLSSQVADLHAAAEGLHEVMRVADREMRDRFQSALHTVSEEFGRIFKVMLRGGEARLDQIDEEGGIEVRATLPGRRARSSSAFSGGERALVASSLLFAVLRIRPMPFCVLDEVDAALDETNVDRYLAALRDISERTQVIVVTHNRATMAAATVLYGLTMDGEGVSSVLSLRLEAYDAAG